MVISSVEQVGASSDKTAWLDVICKARGLARLTRVVSTADPKTFLYTQELAALRGGYVLGLKSKL